MGARSTRPLAERVAASLAAAPDDREELELWLAERLIARGDVDAAAELLSGVVARGDGVVNRERVARHLIDLAGAWARLGTEDARAEECLRHAAHLAPVLGAPRLAKHLQRAGRAPEALEVLRRLIGAHPQVTSARLDLARQYDRLEQPAEALRAYLDVVDVAPTIGNYLLVADRLERLARQLPAALPHQALRLALIGNASLDHLHSYVRIAAYQAGLRPTLYQGPFDQYTQDVVVPTSDLYTFEPDVVVCAIHASRLFPQLHHDATRLSVDDRRAEMEAGLATIQTLLDALTQRSRALVLVHNMVAPQYPALGILDTRDALGQAAIFAELNARLAELVRTRYASVYIVDEDRLQAQTGKVRATDPRLWATARMPWSESMLLALSSEYMRFVRPLRALNRKCIVVDLDNTLWGGVIGEDGVTGIQLGAEAPGNAFVAFQTELDRLRARGVLLAIASKNNVDDVQKVFADHPGMVLKREHFAAERIGWQPKSTSLREIAAELNLGLDSLVFLDDNPVERAAVRAELPEVLVPELPRDPVAYRTALLDLGVFETLTITDEDRRRSEIYAAQAARRASASQVATNDSLEGYLADLQIVVEIEEVQPATLARVAQLTNKTNQFNLTTRRYTEAHLQEMQRAGARIFTVRAADRFGDNGLVGVAVLERPGLDVAEVDTLLLSCRVMGRGVESALLAYVADEAFARGCERLQGRYLPTAKNAPASDCYARHGFSLVAEESDGRQLWERRRVDGALPVPGWLVVRTPELAP